MIVGYMVPIDKQGFSTRSESAVGREIWCKRCAEPCDVSLSPPMDFIAIEDHAVVPFDECRVCQKRLEGLG